MSKAGISRLSQIGIIREIVQGVNPGGISRGLLVPAFAAKPIKSTDRAPEISGNRLHRIAAGGGTHYEVSFTLFAGPISSTAATIAEIIHMILGQDTVSGAGAPYTHKFEIKESAFLPSYSIWQKITNGIDVQYKVYSGFRINTASLVFNREESLVSCEVAGFALSETIDSTKTLVFSSDAPYSTRNQDITIAAADLFRYRAVTVNFDCLSDVFNPLSTSTGPHEIISKGLNISVEVDGLKAIGASPILRDIFKIDTVQTSELKIYASDGTVNNKISIVIPKWQILEVDDEAISAEDYIPEKATFGAIHNDGGAGSMPYVEIIGNHNSDYDNL